MHPLGFEKCPLLSRTRKSLVVYAMEDCEIDKNQRMAKLYAYFERVRGLTNYLWFLTCYIVYVMLL